jgi:hypothetical protein
LVLRIGETCRHVQEKLSKVEAEAKDEEDNDDNDDEDEDEEATFSS